MKKPNPGSREAEKEGCTCPVLDNSYGGGYYGTDNFVINLNCPLHKMGWHSEPKVSNRNK